jgi:hypothetical protein
LLGKLAPEHSAAGPDVLAELDRLENALAGAPHDSDVDRRIVRRLRKIIADRTRPAMPAPVPGGAAGSQHFADALESADAEDVLKLIDARLSRGKRN